MVNEVFPREIDPARHGPRAGSGLVRRSGLPRVGCPRRDRRVSAVRLRRSRVRPGPVRSDWGAAPRSRDRSIGFRRYAFTCRQGLPYSSSWGQARSACCPGDPGVLAKSTVDRYLVESTRGRTNESMAMIRPNGEQELSVTRWQSRERCIGRDPMGHEMTFGANLGSPKRTHMPRLSTYHGCDNMNRG